MMRVRGLNRAVSTKTDEGLLLGVQLSNRRFSLEFPYSFIPLFSCSEFSFSLKLSVLQSMLITEYRATFEICGITGSFGLAVDEVTKTSHIVNHLGTEHEIEYKEHVIVKIRSSCASIC